MKFQGTITALVTPFINQELDEKGFVHNINYQIKQGINGILVLGSTGESATLSSEEQSRIISIAVREAKGKVPIWVGTGTNCTRHTIEKTKKAKDLGADAALIVTPYYNKPTQEGIFRHFEACATNVDIPIVHYNVPSRCGINVDPKTLLRMANLPNFVGVKEASGDFNQICEIFHTICEKYPDFFLLSGDDALTLPMMAIGASGSISVVSNLLPAQVAAVANAALKGNFDLARKLHFQLLALYKAAFIETNPIPIKTAMQLCKMPSGECRLPLCQMREENVKILQQLLKTMHLIEV